MHELSDIDIEKQQHQKQIITRSHTRLSFKNTSLADGETNQG